MKMEAQPDPAQKIDHAIKRAWMVAIFTATITMLVGVMAIAGARPVASLDGTALIDAAILYGLAFGIYKRSRICAVGLILYVVIAAGLAVNQGTKVSPLQVIFAYFYCRGLLAIFTYHKQLSSRSTPPVQDTPKDSLKFTVQPSAEALNALRTRTVEASPTAAQSEPRAATPPDEPSLAVHSQLSTPAAPISLNWRISRKSLLAAAAVLLLAAISIAAWRWSASTPRQANFQKTRNSVVLVEAFDGANKAIATGSGFFVSPDGTLVTNFHVIKGASRVVLKLETGATFEVEGALNGNENSDIALLRAKATGVPFLKLGNSVKAEVGDHVWVIGSPRGFEGTVSDGIISAKREAPGNAKLLQITAPISPGSSGSPVLDANNEVLGVATLLVRESQGLNFAVPIEVAKVMLAQVKSGAPLVALETFARGRADTPAEHDVAALTSLAEKGDLEAQVRLVSLYAKGDPVLHVTKNLPRARAMYERTKILSIEDKIRIVTRFANAGFPPAEHDLGIYYLTGDQVAEDASEAARWFRKAADHQHVDAMRFLAMLYSEGSALPKDPVVAASWAQKAVDQGNHEAELLLGQMYLKGDGVPTDSVAGEKWILKAAIGGVAAAQVHLALGYFLGEEMPKSYDEAAKWAYAAARQGEPSAQVLLGDMYAHGYGVPNNEVLSYAWANAAEPKLNGNPLQTRAAAIKTSVRRDLLHAEIVHAEALSMLISQGRFDEAEAEAKRLR